MNGSHGAGGRGPTPDGRHDDLLPEDLAGLTLHVPDDPRSLDDDRVAWLAEESGQPPTRVPFDTWEQRRASRRRRLVLTAAIAVLSVLIVTLSGAVGALFVAPLASSPPAAPLADGLPEPGQAGGLLPDIVLADGSTPVAARSLRPAVIALVPASCPDCGDVLSSLAPEVGSFGVDLVALGVPEQAGQLAALEEAVGSTRVRVLTDPDGELSAAYGASDLTLLLVRDDGAVIDIVTDPSADTHLGGSLVDLVPATGT